MKRKQILIASIFILTFGACKNKNATVSPERKDIVEVVYASGNLFPESEYKVIGNITGYLTEVLVQEGDTVKQGQALFVVQSSNRQSDLEAAKTAMQIAEENAGAKSPVLAQIHEKIAAAKSRLHNDSLTQTRYRKLLQSEAIAQADYDKVSTTLEASRRDYLALNDQLRAQQKSLQLDLAQALNRYNQAKNNLGDALITSQTNGVVYELNKQRGDFIHQNEAIALLGSGRPIARLSVDEADMRLVQPGQKVMISFDAWPGKMFNASVERIFPKVNKTEQSFRVDTRMPDSLEKTVYGMNLEANIIIRSVKNALSIPRQALLIGDSLRIQRSGKAMTIKVSTGAGDLSYIEITKGLNESDQVIMPGEKP
ncbi:MAG: efflux RND transporter periplasmic adaptor subunit [Bacteroidia bacterium]|nr:efflux RND transporter periplasmic adaptor subunit [Bacteroidia bacterium]